MSGDYSRITHDALRRYSALLMQQGKVLLDADFNELVDILTTRIEKLSLDALGNPGLPFLTNPDAFRVSLLFGPPDLSVAPGRIYLDGVMGEVFEDQTFTYFGQPFRFDLPPLPSGDAAIYVCLWEEELTWVEAPLLDPALGGVDTTTRRRTIVQLHVDAVQNAECGLDVGPPPSAGRLTTRAIAPPEPDDPCILPPSEGYRGLENRLYRIEIHDPGPIGTATFKWSGDNGSVKVPVEAITVSGTETELSVPRLGRDPVMRFSEGDWVTVTDDHREWMDEPGEMAQVIDTDEARGIVRLDRDITSVGRPFGMNATMLTERHTRLQKWDQSAATNPTIDGNGLIATSAGPIDLHPGTGIQIAFSTDPDGGSFRRGDWWVFWARTPTAEIEELTNASPRGIIRHCAQIAAASGLSGPNPVIIDCRPGPPEAEPAVCCCCEITVSTRPEDNADFETLAAAVNAIASVEPNEEVWIVVCLKEGEHLVPDVIGIRRPRVILRGCGPGTILRAEGSALLIESREVIVEDLAIQSRTQDQLIFLFGENFELHRLRLQNVGQGPAIRAFSVNRLRIEKLHVRASGGLQLQGTEIEVRDCMLAEGPVLIEAGSEQVRINGNEIVDSVAEGIILGGNSVISEIEVQGNRIHRARRSGIASGHFDSENEGGDGIIDGLMIRDNEIVNCITQNAERSISDPPFAGIALGRVYDLSIRDNRILRNGELTVQPVCGVYVRHSRGAEISCNRIERNGVPGRRPIGLLAAPQGVRAGIALMDARAAMAARRDADPAAEVPGFAELAAAPAAHVAGNAVSAPQGHALRVVGQGPMRILDNRFQAREPIGEVSEAESAFGGAEGLVASVFIANLGAPSWLGSLGAALGFDLLTGDGIEGLDGSDFLGAITAGGQTQYRGNQVRLDLTQPNIDVFLANQFVASLDDTLIMGNQSEGIFTFLVEEGGIATPEPSNFEGPAFVSPTLESDIIIADLLLADLYNFGITTRQADNGLMTAPLLTMFSIFSVGIINHCTNNQTTSCIAAIGSSSKSVSSGNAVLWPHPQFCPERR